MPGRLLVVHVPDKEAAMLMGCTTMDTIMLEIDIGQRQTVTVTVTVHYLERYLREYTVGASGRCDEVSQTGAFTLQRDDCTLLFTDSLRLIPQPRLEA